jgi:hypothetical protein
MNLDSEQRKKLRDALISAFPEWSSLEQMLYFELGRNLNEITKDSNSPEVAFRLIQTAESQGWLEDLICAARKQNPGNQQLQAIEVNTGDVQTISPKVIAPRAPYQENIVSEVDADYNGLQELLQNKKFKEADFETTRIMLWILSKRIDESWTIEDFQDFPFTDLRTINNLWLAESNNKFGFSIQQEVWITINNSSNPKIYKNQNFKNFIKALDWENENAPLDKRAKKGHFPKGIYVLTRENRVSKIVEKYLNEYHENFHKELENIEDEKGGKGTRVGAGGVGGR